MLKLYINRSCDTARRESMERDFPGFERFNGTDGTLTWGSGRHDDSGRELWDRNDRRQLVNDGVLHPESPLYPAEFGCAWSHLKSWRCFLRSDLKTAVILEDDVRPVTGMRGFEWWINTVHPVKDIIYLFSPHHPGQRIGLHKDGRVRWCRSHMGVMMTRAGAAAAIEAMTPIYYMQDTQLSRINIAATKPCKLPADMWGLSKVEMYGLWNGLVEHNEHAKKSTMTRDGKKPWIRERMLP